MTTGRGEVLCSARAGAADPGQCGALAAAYTAMEAGRFGLFDTLLLATASQAGCTVALSEGMHDGARLHDIVVRNPFADDELANDLRPLFGLS